MKTRKLPDTQLDFLSPDTPMLHWHQLALPTQDQAEQFLSELMLSAISVNRQHVKEDPDVQN